MTPHKKAARVSEGLVPHGDPAVAMNRPPPLDPQHRPPLNRYCDLVLKGGVVDGVVYPWAIVELARSYRFRSVSGTSVGAVAAALTAASEYSRRHGSDVGFNEVLRKLPEQLAEDVGGQTRLFSLFQPKKGAGQRLFDLFVGVFGPNSKLMALLRAYGGHGLSGFLAGSVVSFAIAWGLALMFGGSAGLQTWAMCLLVLLAGAAGGVVALGLTVWSDAQSLAQSGYGICSGQRMEAGPGGRDAFTDWLHEGIQAASGRPMDCPLTFRDLWEAPGGPYGAAARAGERSIDLRMVSTNLTHGRPYGLPLVDQTSRLFFLAEELRPYFPASVVDFMVAKSEAYAPRSPADPSAGDLRDFRELPRDDLPVLVATRMSLSFPVLFKAVPLYAIDYESQGAERRLRRCWFADGGICANFLIHQFDALLPQWPTFGIALEPEPTPENTPASAQRERVWVTKYYNQGRGDTWNRFDAEAGTEPARKNSILDYLFGLLDTMMDWNDNTSMRMPGVRDRVARLKLKTSPGVLVSGLNLAISGREILKMAHEFGTPAGQRLAKKFSPSAATAGSPPMLAAAWNEHRWVRFHTFVHGLRERIAGFESASEHAPYSLPLSQQIQLAQAAAPLRGRDERNLSATQIDALEQTRLALIALERSFALADAVQPYKPVPPPEMRLRMPL